MNSINNIENLYDVIVVGAGAAGMTAALYSLRAGKKVAIIESTSIGGQIANSPRVENFPTIKEISGVELSDKLFDQIDSLGVTFELDKIINIEEIRINEKRAFKLTGEYNTYYSLVVILATGSKHRHIGVSGEEELIGKGVSYCAVCDGSFYKGEEVCLIGDANTALQYTMLLSNYCKKIYLNTLFDHFFGEKTLIEAVRKKENVVIEHCLELQEFLSDDEGLTGLVFKNTITQEIKQFNVKAVFICVGQKPENEQFANVVELNKQGYIITNDDMETLTTGIYAVGDCRSKKIRQLTTAVNDGTIAAVNACNYIDKM